MLDKVLYFFWGVTAAAFLTLGCSFRSLLCVGVLGVIALLIIATARIFRRLCEAVDLPIGYRTIRSATNPRRCGQA
jgi:hypothetical protein